jgi:ABC-type multidrug transport system ATPase subunit
MSTPMVLATGLTKDYGDRPALLPVDLRVERGEQIALIGHNGSGKSTFLKMAAGMLDPTGGTLSVAGHVAGSLRARSLTSYLADTPTFYDDLSVWEHLEYVSRLHGVADWEQPAADLLGEVGLFERSDDLPMTFSRGLRQKAAIALAFCRPFQLMLVDEPFVGLDARGREALLEMLAGNITRNATSIVATHELGFAATAERMVVLADGEIVYDGPGSAQVARDHLG